MAKIALLVAVLGVAAFQGAFAAQCLTRPYPAASQACSASGATCPQNTQYCDRTSTCVPRLALGATCLGIQNECPNNSKCQGTPGAMTCVAYAGVGQTCSPYSNTTTPLCGGTLQCDPLTLKCIGGVYGDSCTNNVTDCSAGLQCLNGKCAGWPAGFPCTSSDQCAIGLFCETSATFPTCVARKTSGRCNSDTDCASTYFCVEAGLGDDKLCTKRESLPNGAYCGTTNAIPSLMCQSNLRCTREGYCAAARLDSCTSSSNCAVDQFCACDGNVLTQGHGSCISNKCTQSLLNLLDCSVDNCNSFSVSTTLYPGSCMSTNCVNQINAYIDCAGAGQIVASFVFVALALVASRIVAF